MDEDVVGSEVTVDDLAGRDMSHAPADLMDDIVLLRYCHLASLLRQPVAEDAVLAPLQRYADAAIAVAEGAEAVDHVGMLGDAAQDRDFLLDFSVPLASSSSMLQHQDRFIPHGPQVSILEGAARDRAPHIYNGWSQHSRFLLLLLSLHLLRRVFRWSRSLGRSWATAGGTALLLDRVAFYRLWLGVPVEGGVVPEDLRLLHWVLDADGDELCNFPCSPNFHVLVCPLTPQRQADLWLARGLWGMY
mmetsp:Transcript_11826/g.40749  ORF Transcript_11826/g.40749 Transcript_11826/m.40749 type:complete len:246 (+) Transcript_11826:468-1205(+)